MNLRHLAYFVALGLFWGISPSQYAYWGKAGVPVSHILVYTGFGLAVFLAALARWKHGAIGWNRDVLRYSLICAVLMNVPFSLSLTFARHVPAAELALIWSLSPIVNFVVGAMIGPRTGHARGSCHGHLAGFLGLRASGADAPRHGVGRSVLVADRQLRQPPALCRV